MSLVCRNVHCREMYSADFGALTPHVYVTTYMRQTAFIMTLFLLSVLLSIAVRIHNNRAMGLTCLN